MATEPQKICPPTPRKAKRKFATEDVAILAPAYTTAGVVIDCDIDPKNPMRAILSTDLKGSDLQFKAIRVKNSDFIIRVHDIKCNDSVCKIYNASVSHGLNVIHTNCVLRFHEMTLDMKRYYDEGELTRTLTLAVMTSAGKYVDFTQTPAQVANKQLKCEKTEAAKHSLDSLNLEWADKPAPLSFMFKTETKISTPPKTANLNKDIHLKF